MGNAPGVGEVPITFNDTIWQRVNDLMCTTVGVNDAMHMEEVHIFPNPSTGLFSISTPAMVEVMDVCGRSVIGPIRTDSIDLSGHSDGVYLVRITLNGNMTVRRVVKGE
jgi:hypothetical protein